MQLTNAATRARGLGCCNASAEDFRDRGKIDLSEAFVDATFASAKKGALKSVQRAVAKAPRSWRSATTAVFLSPCTWPALHRMSHHLVPATLDARFLPDLPWCLIGDRDFIDRF